MVEARGRTSRSNAGAAKKSTGRGMLKAERLNKPPSWSAAFNRAGIATLLFIVVVVLLLRKPVASAVALGAFMMIVYVPLSYYTDSYIYKRRQKTGAKKA
jgi:O-antigen/teichoic acid export membrane protein